MIMERQKNQREELISQIQRCVWRYRERVNRDVMTRLLWLLLHYNRRWPRIPFPLFLPTSYVILTKHTYRDMDEARSILKDATELVSQATATISRSMKLATAGRSGDTDETSGKTDGQTSRKVKGSSSIPSGSKVQGGLFREVKMELLEVPY